MNPEINAQKGFKTLSFSKAVIGDNNLIAAVSGQRIYILGIAISANGGANTAQLQDTGTATLRSPVWDMADDQEFNLPVTPPNRWWDATEADKGLDLNLSAGTVVSGTIVYQQF